MQFHFNKYTYHVSEPKQQLLRHRTNLYGVVPLWTQSDLSSHKTGSLHVQANNPLQLHADEVKTFTTSTISISLRNESIDNKQIDKTVSNL